MKKLILCLFVFSSILPVTAQNLEINSGINRVGFYKGDDDPDATYTHRIGYCLGFSAVDIGMYKYRMTLKLDNHRGKFHRIISSPGGTSTTLAEINKFNLALEAYPLNFMLLENLRINLGGEISLLLFDKTSGFREESLMGDHTYLAIAKGSLEINKKINYGIIGHFAYDIRLSDNLYISPQFLIYIGLSKEFKNISIWGERTLRPYFEIGLKRKLQ